MVVYHTTMRLSSFLTAIKIFTISVLTKPYLQTNYFLFYIERHSIERRRKAAQTWYSAPKFQAT